jgi:rhodanese-related sulfurtransferase
MEPVTNKLRRTRLFASIPESGLIDLVERPGITSGRPGEAIAAAEGDLVVLLEGGLVMTSHEGGEHLAAFSLDEGARDPAILYTIPRGAHLNLTRSSIYLVIEGERLDALLSAPQERLSLDDGMRERVAALLKAAPFKGMSFEQVVQCAEAMESQSVIAGEDVVREGEAGDFFYVIDHGSAEVWRRSGDAPASVVADLGPGSTFGEEALLQGSPRNATVRMKEDGSLLRLSQADFDRLLKSHLVSAVAPAEVARRIKTGGVDLIDCRTEEEWELWRLPKSRLMPLETIRERARGLDKGREYIVYCRTGRRSSAAAFLMRQMGLTAYSMRGGITQWPYEVEGISFDL